VNLEEADPESLSEKRLADTSGEFRRSLEQFPLRFSFQDGVIEELCPSDSEATWALNIKRGVLSVFQNTMDDFQKDQRVNEVTIDVLYILIYILVTGLDT
jgi:hypothetical protein